MLHFSWKTYAKNYATKNLNEKTKKNYMRLCLCLWRHGDIKKLQMFYFMHRQGHDDVYYNMHIALYITALLIHMQMAYVFDTYKFSSLLFSSFSFFYLLTTLAF